jgi:hypothetical protein
MADLACRFKAHYGLSATIYRNRYATGAAHLQRPAPAMDETAGDRA